jgi:tetratricopeptide (TPR) repeat protein
MDAAAGGARRGRVLSLQARLPADAHVYQSGELYWTWLLPAAAALVLARYRRRVPVLLAAAGVLVLAVAPVLGLTPFMFQAISTVSDHYLYLAMLGPALAVGWLITRYPARLTYALAAGVLALLAMRSTLQASVWQDSHSLFAHAVQTRPDNDIAHSGYGNVLARRGEYERALDHFRRAIEIEPRNSQALSRLAMAQLELGRPELAIDPIVRAIDIIETHPAQLQDARREHVIAALAFSRVGRYAEALQHLAAAQADARDPAAAEAMQSIASAIRRGELPPPNGAQD